MTKQLKSTCCGAEAISVVADEGTGHYECEKCNKACDVENSDGDIDATIRIKKHLKIPKEYCSHCGRLMVKQKPILANNFGQYPSYEYDYKTGKKRMINWIACPKYSQSFLSAFLGNGYKHSNHSVGKEFLE